MECALITDHQRIWVNNSKKVEIIRLDWFVCDGCMSMRHCVCVLCMVFCCWCWCCSRACIKFVSRVLNFNYFFPVCIWGTNGWCSTEFMWQDVQHTKSALAHPSLLFVVLMRVVCGYVCMRFGFIVSSQVDGVLIDFELSPTPSVTPPTTNHSSLLCFRI